MTVSMYIAEWPQKEQDDDEAVTVCATALCMAALGMHTEASWRAQVEISVANTHPNQANYLRKRILDADVLAMAESRALHILDWLYRHEHAQG